MNTSSLIAEAIAAGRVRRFEPDDGSDFLKLQNFMRQRGYILSICKNSYFIKREGQPGKARAMHWLKVIEFIDDIRLAEGLQPLRVNHKQTSRKAAA